MVQKKITFKIAMGNGIEEVEGIIKSFKECPNEEFGIRKVLDVWEATHIRSGLLVTRGKTQKICLDNLKNIFNDVEKLKAIHEAKDIDTVIEEHKEWLAKQAKKNQKFQKLRNEFRELTGITCPIDPLIGGINIIKFDKMLGTPDNVSISDYLKEKYGERANQIVDEMINNI